MNRQNIFLEWLIWQYAESPKILLQIWKNYILFALNFFSLTDLVGSFFSPWKRYRWVYPKGLDIGGILSTFISNAFSRFLGSVMRMFLIIAGVLFQISVILSGAVIFLFWLFLPIIVIFGFMFIFIY